ncbi:MAG: ribose 5-phosphate isomerase A [Clostridia bacterium]|nr:ribose 5-phosphate isomerase A [Clostridia bacterium]
MSTNEDLINNLEWNNNIKNKEKKEVLARKIASKVNDGDVISFGSGTTSFLAVKEIAKKCENENLIITAIPTSNQIKKLCEYLNIKTANLGDYKIDWGFDGADEVDDNNWLIKGLGGALFKEKMNLKQSPVVYILVDDSKLVKHLGEKCPVPVECELSKIEFVTEELKKLGAVDCKVRIKENTNEYFVTDNGNGIIDAKFNNITEDLEQKINNIDGVIENGLFIGYDNIEIIK